MRALSRREVERRGLHVFDSAGLLHDVEQVVGHRPDGAPIRRPAKRLTIEAGGTPRFLTPDPGWNYNPGRARPLFDLEPTEIGPVVGGRTFRDFDLPPIAETPRALWLPAPPTLPKQPTTEAALAQLVAALRVPAGGQRTIEPRAPGVAAVVVRRESLFHLVDARHLVQHRERWAARIEAALTDPLEVWLAPVQDLAGRVQARRRFFAVFDDADRARGFMGVAQENKDGSLLWTGFEGAGWAGRHTWTRTGRESCSIDAEGVGEPVAGRRPAQSAALRKAA